MSLFPELEKILIEEAMPLREKNNQDNGQGTNFPQIDLGTPQLCLIDLTKPMQETIAHIAGYNALSTNYFVLIENPETNKWIVISTQKPHYIRGYSDCGMGVVKYSGKEQKITRGSSDFEWLKLEKWEGDVCKPAVPSPDTIAKFFYAAGKYFMRKGYKAVYTSLETARTGERIIAPEEIFAKVKLKLNDDPMYHKAVSELEQYIMGTKQHFEEQGVKLSCISIEYNLIDWRDEGQNPFKMVVRNAIKNLPFKVKCNCIDPYGSGDGGTYHIELEPTKGRKVRELFTVGFDGKPTNDLSKREYSSEVSKISLDAISHFV